MMLYTCVLTKAAMYLLRVRRARPGFPPVVVLVADDVAFGPHVPEVAVDDTPLAARHVGRQADLQVVKLKSCLFLN